MNRMLNKVFCRPGAISSLKTGALLFFAILLTPMHGLRAQDNQDEITKCAMSIGSDATYLRDFVVKLDAAGPDKRPPVYRQSLALRKGVVYRFSVCNLPGSEGSAVLRLYDEANLILSTFYPETGKEYNPVNFQCNKTGAYTIVISFREGKPGHAVGILAHVNK